MHAIARAHHNLPCDRRQLVGAEVLVGVRARAAMEVHTNERLWSIKEGSSGVKDEEGDEGKLGELPPHLNIH